MRLRKKKYIIIGSLCALLIIMAIGYAAFQTNLDIKGTSNISSNWDILITNVKETNKTGDAETAGTPTWTNLTASVEANLYQKGDSIEYDITVENRGNLDAKLENINTNQIRSNEAVKISLTNYTKGQKLEKGSSQIIKVRIEYNPEFTGTPEEGSTEISFDLQYTQNDNYQKEESGEIISSDRYLITYDCTTNGGNECTNYNEYLAKDNAVNLSYTSNKDGYEFVGWNTEQNAHTGISEMTVNGNLTLHAIYQKTLNVTYKKDETISNIEKSNEICKLYNNDENCEITLPGITATNGYGDSAWYIGNTKVGAKGDKYAISSSVSLTAKANDISGPKISLDPNKQEVFTTGGLDVAVNISDSGSGLQANQKIYYAWCASDTERPTYTKYLTTTNESGAKSTSLTIPKEESKELSGTYYLWIKEGELDVSNNASVEVVSEAFNFDNAEPTIELNTTKTINTITVVASVQAASGITKYEYSKDGGSTWTNKDEDEDTTNDEDNDNLYTFKSLTSNTSYQVKVRVTNGVGKVVESEAVPVITDTLATPIYTETKTDSGTDVTITYPEGCGDTISCFYQKGEETEVEVTKEMISNDNKVTVNFALPGTVAAWVNDEISGGTNVASSSYVPAVEIKAVNVSYDNTKTGLECTETQCALGEIRKMLAKEE